MGDFGDIIYNWYTINKRDLPWRKTTDPYVIWLSEIILQQTRVNQGLEYFYRFVDRFPSVVDLAKASEDEVLKMWQGLGYYSRARNLHAAAKYIQLTYHGKFPSDYSSILSLKGVGEYTAAAIASIAFNLPYAVVDGNVYRLLSRFFGIQEPIDSTPGKKIFAEVANDLLNKLNPGKHNQAMMEFGALQCVPVNPDCENCPLVASCFAFENKIVDMLPVKAKKVKTRNRYFSYLVVQSSNFVYIRKRIENDIWKNLYEFPLIETDSEKMEDDVLTKKMSLLFDNYEDININSVSDWRTHILSHQKLFYRFVVLSAKDVKKVSPDLIKVDKKDIFDFAVPRLLEEFINNSKLF